MWFYFSVILFVIFWLSLPYCLCSSCHAKLFTIKFHVKSQSYLLSNFWPRCLRGDNTNTINMLMCLCFVNPEFLLCIPFIKKLAIVSDLIFCLYTQDILLNLSSNVSDLTQHFEIRIQLNTSHVPVHEIIPCHRMLRVLGNYGLSSLYSPVAITIIICGFLAFLSFWGLIRKDPGVLIQFVNSVDGGVSVTLAWLFYIMRSLLYRLLGIT